jgi:aldehyde dehydrogenase (NAD+)
MAPGSGVKAVFEAQEAGRWRLGASSARERKDRLRRLQAALATRKAGLTEALAADLGKPTVEALVTEYHPVMGELKHALRHLDSWMRPDRVGPPLTLLGTRSRIHWEPKGRVLILAPWNYPAFLVFAPLVSALAAGNAVVLKPSEKAPATESFIAGLIRDTFPPEEVAVVTGGPEAAQELVALPFDHIFFTGSPAVGRKVMEAAARNLTSVTLELGGKSPALVGEGADLDLAARRIAWGKWINAGQTCVAPDYVLVPAALEQAFLARLRAQAERLFGARPLDDGAYGRLVDVGAFARQRALLAATKGELVFGGELREGARSLAPTVFRAVAPDDPLMGEELFGPILPVLAYRDREEALAVLRRLGDPLASYLFTADPAEAEAWLRDTRAGGTVVNHTVLHLANPGLPFGGRGTSGLGSCHGVHGFRAFSHARAVLKAGWLDMVGFTFPPYGGRLQALVLRVLDWIS